MLGLGEAAGVLLMKKRLQRWRCVNQLALATSLHRLSEPGERCGGIILCRVVEHLLVLLPSKLAVTGMTNLLRHLEHISLWITKSNSHQQCEIKTTVLPNRLEVHHQV